MLGLGLGLSGRSAFAADVTGKPQPGKIGDFKISLAEWSLHKALCAKKQIDNLDFPKIARETYGIERRRVRQPVLQGQGPRLRLSQGPEEAGQRPGVTCVLIMIDGEGDLSAKDKTKRDEGRREPQEVGRRRGGARLPCDPREHRQQLQRRPTSQPSPRPAARSPNTARQQQDQRHLREPRRSVEQSRRPARPDQGGEQAPFRHAARLRQLPQERTASTTIDIYDAIARMMPYAKGVSAKSYDFDA